MNSNIAKSLVKNIVGIFFSPKIQPIVVNSYGRSGSTMLMDCIIQGTTSYNNSITSFFIQKSIKHNAWNLEDSDFKKGHVYKTHDYPPINNDLQGIKMVYIFSDPVNTVLSLLRLRVENGEDWMRQHFRHLNASYDKFEDILKRDTIGLERHFTSWIKEDRFKIAFIRYEALWNLQDELSDFLGTNIILPPYKERKALGKDDDKIIWKIKSTYSKFRETIANADDFIVN